eukprot:571939-Pyramimonas_sp.AAC.1
MFINLFIPSRKLDTGLEKGKGLWGVACILADIGRPGRGRVALPRRGEGVRGGGGRGGDHAGGAHPQEVPPQHRPCQQGARLACVKTTT